MSLHFLWSQKAFCTCQGQELGLATSPPTTLSSGVLCSRYLGWGSASTEQSRAEPQETDRSNFMHLGAFALCVRNLKGEEGSSYPRLRERSTEETWACLQSPKTFLLSWHPAHYSFIPSGQLLLIVLCVACPTWTHIHLCQSHGYHCCGTNSV